MHPAFRTLGSATFAGLVLSAGCRLTAQDITFEAELPRTMVFIQEEGRGKVASREMTSFLLEAGFPVIDPALAIDEEAQVLVSAALNGNDGAATQLGRNWGAQVLILGVADSCERPARRSARPSITATTEVAVRALRLDLGEVVSDAVADARDIDATAQAARAKAIRKATQDVITEFIGPLINDWMPLVPGKRRTTGSRIRATSNRAWLRPVRTSSRTAEAPGSRGDPRGRPAGRRRDVATRGIGVVRRSERDRTPTSRTSIRLEGVVVGDAEAGRRSMASRRPSSRSTRVSPSVSAWIRASARSFAREFTLPVSQDSVAIVAQGREWLETVETFAAPRIDKRWAVVVGVGEYRQRRYPRPRLRSVGRTGREGFPGE